MTRSARPLLGLLAAVGSLRSPPLHRPYGCFTHKFSPFFPLTPPNVTIPEIKSDLEILNFNGGDRQKDKRTSGI